MKNLFENQVNSGIISRVEKITQSTIPVWGKMSAGQMLAHCSVGLETALGDKIQKRFFIGLLFGKMAKKQAFGEKPSRKGLPTDKMFKINEDRNADDEKARLLTLITRFGKAGADGISEHPHVFFGELTPDEWGILQYKHIDHHLRQFGV